MEEAGGEKILAPHVNPAETVRGLNFLLFWTCTKKPTTTLKNQEEGEEIEV